MKYIATIFGFVFLSLPLFSQNYRSGDITYTHLSGNTYKISVRTFSNTFNTQNNNCELIINFGDGDTAIAYRINGASTICPGIAKDGQMLSFPTNTLYSLYEVVHTYNLSGNYLITTSYPTREYSVCNISNPLQQEMFLQTRLITTPSIQSNNAVNYNQQNPFLFTQPNTICYYNPNVTDIENDSLYYELIPSMAYGTYISSYSLPQSTLSFSIDHLTGTVTWDKPSAICSYYFAIKISEWRTVSGINYLVGESMQEIWAESNSSIIGIDEEKTNALNFSIYPNPSFEIVNFSVNDDRKLKNLALIVYNQMGQLVETTCISTSNSLVLSVSDMDSGIYYYILKNETELIKSGNFVVLNKF